MSKCYDCRDSCTKDFTYRDILSEDGNKMRFAIHNACFERATRGGNPIYPEKSAPTQPHKDTKLEKEK